MDLETALKKLTSGEAEPREVVARKLREGSGDDAIRTLSRALSEPEDEFLYEIADVLQEIGDAKVVSVFLKLLHSDDPTIRNNARTILERIGKSAPELLVALSRENDPRMRVFAAGIMGALYDDDIVARLLEMLRDPDQSVQDAAIVSLGLLQAPAAVPPIADFLKKGHPWLQFSSLDALCTIGGPEATRELIEALPRAEDSIKVALVDALGRLAPPEALDPLVAVLEGASPAIRSAVLRVLLGPLAPGVCARGRVPAMRPVAGAVAQALQSGRPNERLVARGLEVLSAIGGREEEGVVLRFLGAEDRASRRAAVRAAGAMKLAAAIATLNALLPQADGELAGDIKASLERIRAA